MADEELWPALQRLVRRMRDDVTDKFRRDKNLGREWLDAGIDALAQVIPNVEQTALDAAAALEEERQAREVARSVAEDGVGSGDFAGL